MNEFEKVIIKLKLNLEEIINKFRKIIDNFVNIYNINNNYLFKLIIILKKVLFKHINSNLL